MDEVKSSNFIHPPLPYVEILACCSIYISSAAASLYSFFRETEDAQNDLFGGDFAEGWKVVGRQKDISDYEWSFWMGMIKVLLPILLLHAVLGNIVSRSLPKWKPMFCLVFSLVFLTIAVGFLPVLLVISHCLVAYLCAMTQSVIAVWMASLLILMSLQHDEIRFWQMQKITDDPETSDLIQFISMMSNLRCISFGLEYCWHHTDQSSDSNRSKKLGTSFLDLLVFNFYLPLFGNGPVITYLSFYEKFYSYCGQIEHEKFFCSVQDAVRTVVWYLALELSFHFMYSSAVAREPQVYMYLSSWALCGLVYWTLIVFLMKYVVFYGSTAALTRLDGLQPPRPPRCVSTLYLFTDMWRYFDRGLYEWMKRYIYFPLGGSRQGFIRRVLGSFCSFAFIWYWHGGNSTLAWWMMANWLGAIVEGLAGTLLKQPAVQKLECKMTPAMCRRVRALFGVFTIIPLILSNMVFLSGTAPVVFIIKKIFYHGFPVAPLLLCSLMYCIVQTAMEINRYKNGCW